MHRLVVVSLLAVAVFMFGVTVARVAAQTPEEPVPTEAPVATPVEEVPTEPAAEEPTEPPAEEPPGEEEPPIEEEPVGEVTPTEGEAEEDDGDGDTETWIIIALVVAGIAVVLGIGGLLFGRRGSGGDAASAGWDDRAGETYGKAAALHDAISVELVSTTPVSDDPAARQRWQDIGRRIDDLTSDLHVLETRPKNQQALATLRQMLATLTALRAATTQAAPAASTEPPVPGQPSASEQVAAQIRQRLADFDGDVRTFRTLL